MAQPSDPAERPGADRSRDTGSTRSREEDRGLHDPRNDTAADDPGRCGQDDAVATGALRQAPDRESAPSPVRGTLTKGGPWKPTTLAMTSHRIHRLHADFSPELRSGAEELIESERLRRTARRAARHRLLCDLFGEEPRTAIVRWPERQR